MPYHDSRTLPEDPTVKILLEGQLILEPQDDFTCDIGVNRSAPDHQLSFEVRQRMVNSALPDVILMRVLGKLEPPGVEIDLEPASSAGVMKFVPTDEFVRNEEAHEQDFRWLVDLASAEFHNAEVVINGNDTEPNIQIKDGIFHTALRTDPAVVTVTRTGGATGRGPVQPNLDLHRVASLVGVNIYLPDDTVKFKVEWTQNGERKKMLLDRPPVDSGIKYYEIRINNDPPFIDRDVDPATHFELKEYYKVIDGVVVRDEPKEFKRFELLFEKPQTVTSPQTPDLGTPTIPCMPVGGGGG